jgi:hypothetical protein
MSSRPWQRFTIGVPDDWRAQWLAWAQRRAEETPSSEIDKSQSRDSTKKRLVTKALLLDPKGDVIAVVKARLQKTDKFGRAKWRGTITPVNIDGSRSLAKTNTAPDSFVLLLPEGTEGIVSLVRHRLNVDPSTTNLPSLIRSIDLVGTGAAAF